MEQPVIPPAPVNSNPTVQSSTPQIKHLYKKIVLILSSLFFVGLMGLLAVFFGGSILQSLQKAFFPQNNIYLPINPTDPQVTTFGLYYYFDGQIENVTSSDNGVVITTNLPYENLKSIQVSSTTAIYSLQNGVYTLSNISKLIANQDMELSARYTPDTKTWVIRSITIKLN